MENNSYFEEKIKNEKLKLHIKYISLFAFAAFCMVIILNFCEDSFFKNCISVTSTVTSIILSVIAIILSVTGERTTNEIRNKVSDSVERLEDYTDQSMNMAKELSTSIQQMNELYKNIEILPEMKESLNNFLNLNNGVSTDSVDPGRNESLPADHIIFFLEKTNGSKSLEGYYYFITEIRKRTITPGDIIKHLVSKGETMQDATYTAGMILGSFITGAMDNISTSKLEAYYENKARQKKDDPHKNNEWNTI